MTHVIARGRLRLAPLSVNPHHGLLALLPSRLDPVAFTVGTRDLAPDGLLVAVKSGGSLAIWRGVRIEQVSQRKAIAAIAAMSK